MDLPCTFQSNIPLRQWTTFGIGGCARYLVEIKTIESLQEALKTCHLYQIPYFILGKGSNSLFDDRGFNGAVLINRIDFLENVREGVFRVGAGFSFSLLGTKTARLQWEGLEFASGIPGSVGGAVYMNAGANGKETCDCLHSVEYMDGQGQITTYLKSELTFNYRESPFQQMKGSIVAATFHLQPSETARKKQVEIIQHRTKTQPYNFKSAGCIFRNPLGSHAGALIDRTGLKGLSCGEAQVSELHANFIVNKGEATCKDVLSLIDTIKQQVKIKTGFDLESEVRQIPYDYEC